MAQQLSEDLRRSEFGAYFHWRTKFVSQRFLEMSVMPLEDVPIVLGRLL